MEDKVHRKNTSSNHGWCIENSHFAVCPFSIEMQHSLDFMFSLNFEKDCQIIGELSTLIEPRKNAENIQIQPHNNIFTFRMHQNQKTRYKWTLYRRDKAGIQEIVEIVKFEIQPYVEEFLQQRQNQQNRMIPKLTDSKNITHSMNGSGSLRRSPDKAKKTDNSDPPYGFMKKISIKFPKTDLVLNFVLTVARTQQEIKQMITAFHMSEKLNLVTQAFGSTIQPQVSNAHDSGMALSVINQQLELSRKTIFNSNVDVMEGSEDHVTFSNSVEGSDKEKSVLKSNNRVNSTDNKKYRQRSLIHKQNPASSIPKNQNGEAISKYESQRGSEMHIHISPSGSSPNEETGSTMKQVSVLSREAHHATQSTKINARDTDSLKKSLSDLTKKRPNAQVEVPFEKDQKVPMSTDQRSKLNQNTTQTGGKPKVVEQRAGKEFFEKSIFSTAKNAELKRTEKVHLELNSSQPEHDYELIHTSPVNDKNPSRNSYLKIDGKTRSPVPTSSEKSFLKLDDIILNDKRVSISDNSEWISSSKTKTDDILSRAASSKKQKPQSRKQIEIEHPHHDKEPNYQSSNNASEKQSLNLVSRVLSHSKHKNGPKNNDILGILGKNSDPNDEDSFETENHNKSSSSKKTLNLGLKRKSTVEEFYKFEDVRLSTKPKTLDEDMIRSSMDSISQQMLSKDNKADEQAEGTVAMVHQAVSKKYQMQIPSMIQEEFELTKSADQNLSRNNSNSDQKSEGTYDWGNGLSQISNASFQTQRVEGKIQAAFEVIQNAVSPYAQSLSVKLEENRYFGPQYTEFIKPHLSFKRVALVLVFITILTIFQFLGNCLDSQIQNKMTAYSLGQEDLSQYEVEQSQKSKSKVRKNKRKKDKKRKKK